MSEVVDVELDSIPIDATRFGFTPRHVMNY